MSALDPKMKNDKWTGLGLGQVVLFHGYLLLMVMLMVNGDHTAYHVP